MKRPIVLVAMVYAAGLAMGRLLAVPGNVVLLLAVAIAVGEAAVLLRGRLASDTLLLAAVFLLGVYQHKRIATNDDLARSYVAQLEGFPVVVEGHLAIGERVYEERAVLTIRDCTVRTARGRAIDFPTRIQVVLSRSAYNEFLASRPLPGDRVVVRGRFRAPPELSNPDVFNYRAYLERCGIGATVSVRKADALTFSPPVPHRSPVDLVVATGVQARRWIETVLDSALEPGASRLVRSIVLGQAYLLGHEKRTDFTRMGLGHVFAVSGLHIGILLFVLDSIVRLLLLKPKARCAILILALWLFCSMVGFRPSAVRASTMFTALLMVHFLGYKVEPLTALAVAGGVILAFNPRALWQPSFQLSFVTMFSVILLYPLLRIWLAFDEEKGSPLRRRAAAFINMYFLAVLAVSVSAQLGAIPLLSVYFHRVPIVGVLANPFVLYIAFLMIAGAVALFFSALMFPLILVPLAGSLNLCSAVLESFIGGWSLLPAVSIVTPAWPVAICMLYNLGLFGWAVMPREQSPFFLPKQRARLLIALAGVGAWLVWSPVVLAGTGGRLRATFLDVGQGDSCVIELPSGAVVLVDGGEARTKAGEFAVVPFLESRGIDYVDAVIATHGDSDHVGGLPAVFDYADVGWVIEGPSRGTSDAYSRFDEAAEAELALRYTVFAGDWIETPTGLRLIVLHPPRGVKYANANDASLVLMLDWKECEILIPGDIEMRAEIDLLRSNADLACEVLKVAHHGSARATSAAFLQRARPKLAIISCGRGNPYGHPSAAVLDRLQQAGAILARTDRDGAVTVLCDGRKLIWWTEGKIGNQSPGF